jgi:hypothetical protein
LAERRFRPTTRALASSSISGGRAFAIASLKGPKQALLGRYAPHLRRLGPGGAASVAHLAALPRQTAESGITLKHVVTEFAMERYDFEVLKDNETIAAERSVLLRSPRAAWPRIAELAKKAAGPGCRIRVTNPGETVILVGAASARRYFEVAASA